MSTTTDRVVRLIIRNKDTGLVKDYVPIYVTQREWRGDTSTTHGLVFDAFRRRGDVAGWKTATEFKDSRTAWRN